MRTLPVARCAAALIAAQLLLRMWVAASGYFYWDDLILTGRSGTHPLLSSDFLLYDHDGHLMPLAFAVAWVVTRLAPLQWALPLMTLVVGQTIASLAVLRLLRVLLGWRPVLLLPLALYLFSPLTLPAFAWWSAALNALPLQAALAWVAADAVLLCRTGRRRYAWSGLTVFTVALLFFEKSLVVPAFAFAVAALVARAGGDPRWLRATLRRAAVLWGACAAVAAGWIVLYLASTSSHATSRGTKDAAADMVSRGVFRGVLPALLGGPWSWDQLAESTPWATPPRGLVVASAVVVVVVVAVTVVRRRGSWWAWALAAAYVLVDLLGMAVTRAGALPVLAQTLRHVADAGVVIPVSVALVACAPLRPRARPAPPWLRRVGPASVTAAAAVFVLGSVWSTMTFMQLWSRNSTVAYLETAKASLAEHRAATLLEQPVPGRVLYGLAVPNNLASRIFSPLPHAPRFAATTTDLMLIDAGGRVVPAEVAPGRHVLPGPDAWCSYKLERQPRTLPLDGPLFLWDWTADISYTADRAGSFDLAGETGRSVQVQVQPGLHRVFVRFTGSGNALKATARDGTTVCIGTSSVGNVVATP